MHPLKKYFTEGLIQFTILLSLMGVRVDVDTYLNAQLPPLREIILGQSSAYTQTQFHNWRNTLGGYDLHPKSVDLDYYFTARRLLNDVRGLDRLLVPSTELSAWLVHSGSSREADGSVPASQPSLPLDNTSGVNEGAVAENSDRANGSSEQVEESLGAVGLPMSSELTKEVPELVDQTPSFEECLRLLEETFPFAEDSEFPAAVSSELNEALDSALASTSDSPPASSQTTLRPPLLTPQDTPLDLEQQWQDLLSLMDLQDMDMGDSAASFSDDTSNGNAELPMSYIQPPTTTINQDVSLHDATLPLCGQDFPPFFNANVAVGSGPSLQPLASTNSTDFNTTFGSTNFTGLLFPHRINGTGNETCSPAMADPLRGLLDDAMLDEISLMDLAMEEGFGPMETSQIEEELDSDSGLSLDSSQSPVSPSSSESSSSSTTSSSSSSSSSSSLSLSEEGAVGYSSDSEDTDSEEGQGAVGGHQPEFSKFCRMSYQNPSYFHSPPYLDQIHHNHTYNLPPGASASSPHSPPGPGYKAGFRETRRSCIDLHVGRDERRARVLKIPFTNDKIVNLPVDEFNELLKKAHLTEPQLALIRDIRRRGKNKLAAQNCRKRKLDTILNLDQDVEQLKKQKARLLKEKVDFVKSLRQMKQKLQGLYQEVFDRLRDEDGRPYCPSQYTLQYANNGSMLVMPHTLITQQGKPDKKKGSKKK
ncbi:endoplasmic reticulum membrane sensor NFE2L1 isoform X3 [Amblyraja radiata]|uniref:endoplasmic reticulum membrane sensor NFE2L1 isoform X3 n=1 Tax=Amblyraja radiata TaxID=386614 RepID=UPI0014026F1C|nr:endoplasmic reticulum membrane sensor NFE2L1 isoform X3 [Amblyraja radiata]